MQIRQLEYVSEIARQGNIKRAAEKLYISQQALSETLKLVEEELGFPIFQRTNRGVVPTVNGAKVLQDIDEILRKIYGWESYKESKLDVQFYLQCILSDLLLDGTFLTGLYNFPGVNLKLEAASPEEVIERVTNEKLAIGLLALNEQANAYRQLQRIMQSKKYKVEMITTGDAINVCILMQKSVCSAEKNAIITEEDITGKTLIVNTEMLVIEPIQRLLRNGNVTVHGVPRSVKPMDLIVQDETIITYMPRFLAEKNRDVRNGSVVVRQLAQDLKDKWGCYLLYSAEMELMLQPVIQKIKKYFA